MKPTYKQIVETMRKYTNTIEVEISRFTPDQIDELYKDMESIGYRFDRTESRYISCIMAIFEH